MSKTLDKLVTVLFNVFVLLEDIKEEMKLNANITKVLSEAKTSFSDDEHEVTASALYKCSVTLFNVQTIHHVIMGVELGV